jgi:tetratricopeptide (TPR) repeat protein
MRHRIAILWLSAVAGTAAWGVTPSEAADRWAAQGRTLYLACEFKQAAHAFERAVAEQPGRPALYYWLGKSYARLADIASPFTAPKYARRAGHNLEQAVRIDPRNQEYARELFEFYVDSPEWFEGGLSRARALLEEVNLPEADAETVLKHISDSHAEHSGPSWRMRQAILRTSGVAGSLVPAR